MAVAKQKTVKTRPGTFQKGNKAALGNDKTIRVTTWVERELTESYDELMTKAQKMATILVDKAIKEEDLSFIREVIDRTEGKPQQKVDHTSKGEKIVPILGGLVAAPEIED